ncbi:MAG: Hsp20/alpha crystallin family protein [Thiomonas sp.]|uniref:Hsp20/alpha crystallin family protein n=1 Tax=Thiomonas sp. TaxID=2047785 RepID=UPI002A35B01A|nr:Hsp20/alpha crystallin family protein [Thiomonas sp.]MDY0330687.1 Hsp20/alpha crystallin family protein [Thiomonas sp.]
MAYLLASDLFDQFENMRREMDALFGDWGMPRDIRAVPSGNYPPINIGATPKQVDVYVFAPGMEPQALDISLEQNLLTVAGARDSDPPKDTQVYRRERFNGQFKRVITVPDGIDPDRVNATYKNGILHITIGRREELQPRRIEVR